MEVRREGDALPPPGTTELTMVERATALPGGGCLRHYWRVSFSRLHSDDTAGPHYLDADRARSHPEVALGSGAGCPTGDYVGTHPDLAPAVAIVELTRLHEWRAGHGAPRYRCTDRTGSRLCATAAGLRRELARVQPWMILREQDEIVMWMGQRGGVVTELRYVPSDHVATATVTRFIPAPF
ncbi:MAG: hypothetical protein PGN16_17560 [Sphingomonas phyllosphaerae]|uniref:hypothetical protein n=1 Tax=Sphingomonas phyllosphaerae TaxID=257003 RepID=UPI002FF8FF24